jgi:allantoinase
MTGESLDCLIRGGTVVLDYRTQVLDIGIAGGKIVELSSQSSQSAATEIDASGLHVFPGAVDVHLHFNDPGRADWEGVATGSNACAAGGTTTFCDMPLNSSPPTLDRKSFAAKLNALTGKSRVDFGLWGGLTPKNLANLEELAACGVIGFKAFMCDSGIDDFLAADEETLGRGMEIAAKLALPVAVHAEDQSLTAKLTADARAAGRRGVRDYLDSRPIKAETLAIEKAIALAKQTGCSLHIVHVSSAAGIDLVTSARRNHVPVTCETCPHYLVLIDADVERLGAVAKCSPPIRSADEQTKLWKKLRTGEILFIASDHSPAPASMKQSDDFFQIWGGIAGCQSLLGLMLQSVCHQHGGSLADVARFTATAPARRFSLPGKGELRVDNDADLTLVDLAARPVLRADDLQYRHKVSPYIGMTHGGAIRRTLVRGATVWYDRQPVGEPQGTFIAAQRGASI